MRTPPAQFRFRAVSMEIAAHFEDRRVDMLIVTEDGTTIAIEYENDSILSVQRHIGQMSYHCPQIASWGQTDKTYDTAALEGWHVTPSAAISSWRLSANKTSAPAVFL